MRSLSGVLLLALACAPSASADELRVGVATADITPPIGYRMAGYYQDRASSGTHDPLRAKALVLQQGSQRAAIVLCDLVAIPRDVSEAARSRASAASGIPAADIAVAATHSHTGPLYYGVLRDHFHKRAIETQGRDARESVDYPDLLASRIAQCVKDAATHAVPARLDAGIATEDRIAFNRRFHMKDGTVRFNPGPLNPDIVAASGPIDPEVGLVLARPLDNGPAIAGLTVFALHLDTVGGTMYSADYPHVLDERLRGTFGQGFVSLFGAGTCGDINHIDVKTRDRATTDAIGTQLAETVLAARPALRRVSPPSLAMTRRVINVPTRRATPSEVAEAKRRLPDIGTPRLPFLDAVRTVTTLDLDATYPDHTAKLEVQVLRLGPNLALVFLPGEIFVELGLAIKRGSPFEHTFVIELANSIPAYVPTRKAFGEGSYEIENSRVEPGGGERLVETALELLKELKDKP